MVDYAIYNGTRTALTNVNAGGDDVPAHKSAVGVALDATELEAVLTIAGVAVTKNAPTYQQKRNLAGVLRWRKSLSL